MSELSCQLCGASFVTKYPQVADSLSGEIFQILTCQGCGLKCTSPVPIDLRRYYTNEYHGNRHGITARYCVKRRIRFLNASTKGKGKLLDAGCGEGTFLLGMKALGWEATGTEINPASGLQKRLKVFQSLNEAAACGPFDCITMWHSLEHLAEPLAALNEAGQLVSPTGILLIAVPNAGGLQARLFGRHWLHLDVPRHLRHFNEASLDLLLQKSGWYVQHKWHQEFEYDFLGWIQSALNMALPHPNTFFAMITGKKSEANFWEKLVSWAGASLLAVPAAVATFASTILKRGGTLVVAARRQGYQGYIDNCA